MNSKSFSAWLNRGIALSLFIFIYTSMQKTVFNAGFTDFNFAFHQLDSILNAIKLPLIFCLAGILYAHLFKKSSLEKLMYGLLNYLIYPFVLWTILQGLVQIVFSGYTGVNKLIIDIYFNLTDQPSNHLGLLIGLALTLFVIGLTSFLPKKSYLNISVLSFLAILGLFSKFLGWHYPFNYLSQYGVFLYSGFLGYQYISKNNFSLRFKNARLILFLASLFIWMLSAYILHITLDLNTYSSHPLSFFNSIFSLVLIFSGFSLLPTKNSWFIKLIALNFSAVFFMHEIFGHGTRQILVKSFHLNDTYMLLMLVVSFALLIPLGISHFIFKNHIPSLLSAPRWFDAKVLFENIKHQFQQYKYLRLISMFFIGFLLIMYAWINYKVDHLTNPLANEVGLTHIKLSNQADDINEGRRLSLIYGCYKGCHGSKMEGINFSRSSAGAFYSSNLTHAIDVYTPSELADIVRLGTYPDGKIIKGGMPYQSFNLLKDKELSLILSFIALQPKQSKKTQISVIGLPGKLALLTGKRQLQGEDILSARKIFKTSTNSEIAKGERLTRSACAECHGNLLTGGLQVGAPHLAVAKSYTYSQFKSLMQTGTKLNNEQARLMGTVAKIRYSNFTEDELQAIYKFLTSSNFSGSTASKD